MITWQFFISSYLWWKLRAHLSFAICSQQYALYSPTFCRTSRLNSESELEPIPDWAILNTSQLLSPLPSPTPSPTPSPSPSYSPTFFPSTGPSPAISPAPTPPGPHTSEHPPISPSEQNPPQNPLPSPSTPTPTTFAPTSIPTSTLTSSHQGAAPPEGASLIEWVKENLLLFILASIGVVQSSCFNVIASFVEVLLIVGIIFITVCLVRRRRNSPQVRPDFSCLLWLQALGYQRLDLGIDTNDAFLVPSREIQLKEKLGRGRFVFFLRRICLLGSVLLLFIVPSGEELWLLLSSFSMMMRMNLRRFFERAIWWGKCTWCEINNLLSEECDTRTSSLSSVPPLILVRSLSWPSSVQEARFEWCFFCPE